MLRIKNKNVSPNFSIASMQTLGCIVSVKVPIKMCFFVLTKISPLLPFKKRSKKSLKIKSHEIRN